MAEKTPAAAYTLEDYLQTTRPYEEAFAYHGNPFEYEQRIGRMSRQAEEAGFRGFRKMLAKYTQTLRMASTEIYVDNATEFSGQPLELEAGDWTADDLGVRRRRGVYEEIACCHPVLPVERLVNVDTGVEKLKLWYTRNQKPRSVIVDKSQLASPQKILALADVGVAVNSENAKALIQWLHDAENNNYTQIPEKKSVSRLGFIQGEGFSPYVEGLVFDGDLSFRGIYESIRSCGSRGRWMEAARSIRSGGAMARIVLAASFASALVAPCGALPFFVHLWGGESGTGKTVALMAAASVWGNPEMGRYIQTFNSTAVGREKLVSFLNHLPLLVDELQLAKDARGKLLFDVYALAEGVGRTRGTRTGGIERTPSWANCILTTGESPITTAGAGAGAVNRVIEIECGPSGRIIGDGHGMSALLRKNYGFAGREFAERLYSQGNVGRAQLFYAEAFRALSGSDTTEKQAMAGAVLLTADYLATQWIFEDGRQLTVNDLAPFLSSRAAVSAGERGYRFMCDWCAQNANKLRGSAEQCDVYGLIEGEWVYIIGSVFRRVTEDAGYSAPALLAHLREKGLIRTRGRAMTRGKRINGVLAECVCMKLADLEEDVPAGNLPFGGDLDEPWNTKAGECAQKPHGEAEIEPWNTQKG